MGSPFFICSNCCGVNFFFSSGCCSRYSHNFLVHSLKTALSPASHSSFGIVVSNAYGNSGTTTFNLTPSISISFSTKGTPVTSWTFPAKHSLAHLKWYSPFSSTVILSIKLSGHPVFSFNFFLSSSVSGLLTFSSTFSLLLLS